MKKYKLIVEKNEEGFWGRVNETAGVYGYGQDIEALETNINKALELYFEESGEKMPNYKFEWVMDLQEFFSIHDYINISTIAKRIGMNPSLLRQYAKGIKFPSFKQVHKIEVTIKEIGNQLSKTKIQPS